MKYFVFVSCLRLDGLWYCYGFFVHVHDYFVLLRSLTVACAKECSRLECILFNCFQSLLHFTVQQIDGFNWLSSCCCGGRTWRAIRTGCSGCASWFRARLRFARIMIPAFTLPASGTAAGTRRSCASRWTPTAASAMSIILFRFLWFLLLRLGSVAAAATGRLWLGTVAFPLSVSFPITLTIPFSFSVTIPVPVPVPISVPFPFSVATVSHFYWYCGYVLFFCIIFFRMFWQRSRTLNRNVTVVVWSMLCKMRSK